MKNQNGEVVTGIMIVMMAGVMVFGMLFMHGGHKDHGDRHDHGNANQKHEHTGMQPQHMHSGQGDPGSNAPAPENSENK